VAADCLGIYLQVECAMWNVFQEGNGMDKVLCEETERILESFGHHPSFIALSPSNEPGGDWAPVLAEWYRWCKASEETYSGPRLYSRQSGWPYLVEPSQIDNTDYVYFHRSGYGPYSGGTIRNSVGWADKDYRASLKGISYPVITHEMGQWCSYPDYEIIEKFTGYMQPGNYKVFRENARAAGVLSQNKENLMQIIDNPDVSEEQKAEAVASMVTLSETAEREAAAEGAAISEISRENLNFSRPMSLESPFSSSRNQKSQARFRKEDLA